MRFVRSCVLAAVVFTMMTTAVFAQQKPHIMVNTNVGSGNRFWVSLEGKFAEFRGLVQQAGYTIDDEFLTSITAEKLAGVDILVLAMPELQLDAASKLALRTFIQNGGGVLITADDTSIYPWVNPENLNSFISQFGIEFGLREGGNRDGLVPSSSPLDYPESVNGAESFEGRYLLNVNNAQAMSVATLEGGSIWAAASTLTAKVGMGRLVVMGESRWLTDDPGVNQIDSADNEKLARNLLNFLAGGGFDLSVGKPKLKGRNLVPGDEVTAIVRIRNIGMFHSRSADVTFVVIPVGAVGAAQEVVVLQTSVADLGPGKKTKIKQKLMLPNSLDPGEYSVIVRIDAGGKDINSGNDSKSGKQLVLN